MNISLEKIWSFLRDAVDPLMQEYIPGERDYGELSGNLLRDLAALEPTIVHGGKMVPCRVEILDGHQIDKVYVMSASDYMTRFLAAPWPDDLATSETIPIGNVRRIFASENRLPCRITERIYTSGETGMGYHRFILRYKNGLEETYWVAGSNFDFLDLPPGRSPSEVVDVVPHKKTGPVIRLADPTYHWCLFGAGSGRQPAWYGTGFKFKPTVPVKLVRSRNIQQRL